MSISHVVLGLDAVCNATLCTSLLPLMSFVGVFVFAVLDSLSNVQFCVHLQCDMQKLTVEELKRLLYDTFCDHLSMKDIENIIMTEENHIENPEDCQVDIDSKKEYFVVLTHPPFFWLF